MPIQRDHLLERQNRVYEVLDVATKPAQWLIGGIKAVFLLLIFAGVCIVGPIYALMHGGSFSSFQFAVGCWLLGFLVMFFGVPWYTIIGGAGIFCSLFWWNINQSPSSGNLFLAVLWVYEVIGLLLVAAKIIRWLTNRRKDRQRSRRLAIFSPNCTIDGQSGFGSSENPTPSVIRNQKLSPDSPLPDHLRRKLSEIAQSILDEGELLINQGQVMVDTDALPLDQAMRTTNAMLIDVREQMLGLCDRMARRDFESREEARAAVQRFLALQRTAIRRLSAMVARLKRESLPHVVAEIEQVLSQLQETLASIQRTAMAKGLL